MSQPSLRTSALVLLVTVALLGSAISGTGAVGLAAAAEGPTDDARPSVSVETLGDGVAQQTTPVNNSSLRHRNPDAVDSENRLQELQGVLGSRLVDRLSESSVQLSQEQYDQARAVLGEEYLDQLGKYGEVADERDDENATSARESFNETRETQREYSETVAEFRETVDAYQEAKATGDEARARQLAREAVSLGSEAARQADRLNGTYTQLETLSGANLDDARENVQTVQESVDENRSDIEAEAFVSTTLSVRAADESGSFADPFSLSGTLDSEDGPVSTQRIRLVVGNQTQTVTTDTNGEFDLTYRPTTVERNASNVTVRYVPRSTSVYGGSNTTLGLAIEQVTARADIETVSTETAFGEPVTTRGSLAVDGEAVAGFPLAIRVDGVRIGTARTTSDGSFVFEGSLPATPRSGTQSLTVTAAVDGRAVAVAPADTAIQIRETPTELSVTVADATTENRTALAGTLTAAGRPVADQRVVVRVGGDRVGTARTDTEGSYTVRLDEERGLATVSFDGEGTNLASAEASVSLPEDTDEANEAVTDVEASTPPGFLELLQTDPLAALTTPIGLVAGGVTLGLVGLLAVAVARRRRDAQAASTAAGGGEQTGTGTAASSTADEAATSQPAVDPFASAMAALEEGTTDDAVIEAYAAVRRALAASVVSERARTHWQFFDASVAAGVASEPLRTITEAYETARYGADAPASTLAEEAIAAARALVEGDGEGEDASEAGDADAAPSDD